VRKKKKKKSFAASVNRENLARGAEEPGLNPGERIDPVASAIRTRPVC